MIVRYQIGPFGELSWRALDIAIRLMQKLEPDAEIHVTFQSAIQWARNPDVIYEYQNKALYSHGRWSPERFGYLQHEVWLENDHILWKLPPAWSRFKQREDAVLAWIVDWEYYAGYEVGDFWACPGMFGLPPRTIMPAPPEQDKGNDMMEQAYVAWWLKTHGPHEIVTHDEVTGFNPGHPILGPSHSSFGSCGIHMMGLNRGFQPAPHTVLDRIEKEWL